MPYELPNAIATKHSISLKTVYNYLSKYSSKIRTKKEFWKKFVNIEDFEKFYLQSIQGFKYSPENNSNGLEFWIFWNNMETIENTASNPVQNLQNTTAIHQLSDSVWNSFETSESDLQKIQKLQTDYETIMNEKANSEKYNMMLQDQVSKYSLLAIDEKNEKKEWIAKYDTMQKKLLNATKQTYLLIGVCIALTIGTLWLLRLRFYQ